MQAYALALTISILALALAAAVTASERDENVACLLGRGLVSRLSLLAAKIALATIISLAVGAVILLAFGAIVIIGDIAGGQPWQRIPLVLIGVALCGAALGAIGTLIGALAREGRSATLGALLVALPIVLLGLIPREIAPPAGVAGGAISLGIRPSKTIGSATSRAPSVAERPSRASAPINVPIAPSAAPQSATPIRTSGIRCQGWPPAISPMITLSPKASKITAPTASEMIVA